MAVCAILGQCPFKGNRAGGAAAFSPARPGFRGNLVFAVDP